MQQSEVRLQWDPDHSPSGAPLARRAIQIGLRGGALASYARDWIVDIQDISMFVAEQERIAGENADPEFVTPRELVYPVADPAVAARLAISPIEPMEE